MTTVSIRNLAMSTLAVLVVAGSAFTQVDPAVLNALEVQNLVASTEPGDHARLSAHFTALADRYSAEATRHLALAQSTFGNPNHTSNSGVDARHKRLAELDTESAATLRALAVHHQMLADGIRSITPRGGSWFQGGAGAPEPTAKDLAALAAAAVTPADHRGLEEYFVMLAKRDTARANEHAALAQAFRGTKITQAADHCDRMVAQFRQSATRATAFAMLHEQLADIAR